MPWVAWLTLVGALAIAGLPPLNGFVSEWLLLQAFLFAHEVPHTFVNMLLPLGAALVALAAALAGYVMVKFFGVDLPRPAARSRAARRPTMPGLARARRACVWLALGCVLLGLFPTQVDRAASPRSRGSWTSGELPASEAPWWLLLPIPDRQASYAPLVFLAVIARGRVVLTMLRRASLLSPARAPRRRPGIAASAALTQPHAGHRGGIRPADPASVRAVLRHRSASCRAPFDAHPRYRRRRSATGSGAALYAPLGAAGARASPTRVAWLQQGRIATYLLYSFVTLVVLLALVL